MKTIVGKKVNMLEYFTAEGKAHSATLIEVAPMTVLGKRASGKTEVGFGTQKESRVAKPVLGKTKGTIYRHTKEIALSDMNEGDTVSVDLFKEGDVVSVRGISKGKGFQGVVKRHGFKGGRRSHGQKHSEREPGSIGGGLRTRVPKGMRMAGRMGGDTVFVKNLSVLAVDAGSNTLLIKGAVPGRRGTLIEIMAK